MTLYYEDVPAGDNDVQQLLLREYGTAAALLRGY